MSVLTHYPHVHTLRGIRPSMLKHAKDLPGYKHVLGVPYGTHAGTMQGWPCKAGTRAVLGHETPGEAPT